MVEDRLQDLKSSTCGIFQIYFYHKPFDPDEGSEISGETKLTKKNCWNAVKRDLHPGRKTKRNKNERVCRWFQYINYVNIKSIVKVKYVM